MKENFHDFDVWGLGATVLRIMFGSGSLFESTFNAKSGIAEYGQAIKNEYQELDE